MPDDVIFALSSGQGKAGVAVIRVSGKDLTELAAGAAPRHAKFRNFYGIDNIILIYFKAPNSFTGEDVVELHCHGGAAVIQAIFEKLKSFGYRMAEKGEFARRAFHNGKMDLVEIDAMRELIDAKTEKQRARALAGMTGGSSAVYMGWRNDMVSLAALTSARMDYDAGDLPKDIDVQIAEKTDALVAAIEGALGRNHRIIESGFHVVLAGETNVGKSSLFNAILGEGRAIVSDIHGTTRDVISAELDLNGYLVRLSDTAGIRESKDEIEKIGIEKTKEQMEHADLIIRVLDKPSDARARENEIIVVNKSDLGEGDVSAKTGVGIPELLAQIKQKLYEQLDGREDDLTVNARAWSHLERAVSELSKSRLAPADLSAEHIMNAADEIGQILGIIGSEEIYDSVFGQLCLGK